MFLEEQFPESVRNAEMVVNREKEITEKLRNKEFSVPGKYSVDSVGKYATRAWISPGDPADVKTLARELGELFGVVWKLEFQEECGKFRYVARQENFWGKDQTFLVLVENVPTPLNCTITQKKKVKKVTWFEKKCDREEVNV